MHPPIPTHLNPLSQTLSSRVFLPGPVDPARLQPGARLPGPGRAHQPARPRLRRRAPGSWAEQLRRALRKDICRGKIREKNPR